MSISGFEAPVSPQEALPRELLEDFERATGSIVRSGVPGARCCTLSIGGRLAALVEPRSLEELSRFVAFFSQYKQEYRVLGAGSNLLIPDGGVACWVLRLGREFRSMKALGGGRFDVGGATSLMTVSRELSEAGFSGIEFAGGIPASFGGALRMNSGAHGAEMSDVLSELVCVMNDGTVATFKRSELSCRYRDAGIPAGAVIASGVITLLPSDSDSCRTKRAACLAMRKRTQPLTQPSAGSVFKNLSGGSAAGELLERAGLKGRMAGGAQVSTMHANWIVNPERAAKAQDVRELIGLCQAKVRGEFGIELEPEIVLW